MTPSPGEEVATALGALLQRPFRARLYAELTEDVAAGLDTTTYPVLSGLARVGPCSAAALAEVIGLDRSGVSRRASRLEEARLLGRVADPDDARSVLLTLTPAGRRAVAATRRRLAARIDAYLETWPGELAEAFAAGLSRFVADGPFARPSEVGAEKEGNGGEPG